MGLPVHDMFKKQLLSGLYPLFEILVYSQFGIFTNSCCNSVDSLKNLFNLPVAIFSSISQLFLPDALLLLPFRFPFRSQNLSTVGVTAIGFIAATCMRHLCLLPRNRLLLYLKQRLRPVTQHMDIRYWQAGLPASHNFPDQFFHLS